MSWSMAIVAHPQFKLDEQITVEEFLAFTETRPDGERWELIEGVPVLSPSPVDFYQIVVVNISTFLMNHKRNTGAAWMPLLGIGTRVPASANSLPQPDVFVMAGEPIGSPVTDDALVIFEVLSKSNTKAYQLWRRRVYASVPNCQHYVTVSLKSLDVVAYDRSTNWAARALRDDTASLALPAIAVEMPLAEI
jgi:Uma2 family endonuclease